jgi:hypothetical protein
MFFPDTPKKEKIVGNTLNVFFSAIREEFKKNKIERIKNPFEMRIDLSKLTLQNLIEIGNLPIEILFAKREENFIASTGSTETVLYDIVDDLDEVEKDSPEYQAIIESLNSLAESMKNTTGKFSLHNHPESKDFSAEQMTFPSGDDLEISAESNTELDFITTKYGICAYKATKETLEIIRKCTNMEDFVETVNTLGIIKKVFSFADQESEKVVKYMKGKISKQELLK